MRRILLGFPVAILLAAGTARAGSPTTAGWEKLKSLVGSWQGTADAGPVSATYALVSNGTTLMETLNGGHDADMITMYTPEGATLLATHYCSVGNQPRMRATASADGKSIDFQFVDVANEKGTTVVMRRLVVTFVDGDHFNQQWTSRDKNGKEQTSVFRFTRSK
jgi:hypothetical protein